MKNIPNILSLLRVFLAPIALFYWMQGNKKQAFRLYCVAIVTDICDGYLARRWHAESETGKQLDSYADQAWVVGSTIGLAAKGGIQAVRWNMLQIFVFHALTALKFSKAVAIAGSATVTAAWLVKSRTSNPN